MKNVIITGTSRGIGYELVKLFTDAGFNVLALSRNAAPISSMNLSGCTIFSFDITDSDDIKSAPTNKIFSCAGFKFILSYSTKKATVWRQVRD